MAKISELTPATIPLIGTEPFPLVQGGVTKRAPVSALVGPQGPQGPPGSGGTPGIVDVTDFLGVGGYTDLSIQAAIDFAFNNDISRVRIPYRPSNAWTINNPIFQDPPGNLRGSLTVGQLLAGQTATPTIFGPNISVEADHRTRFTVTFQTAPAWWVGPGSNNDASGQRVSGVNLTNNSVSLGIFAPRLLPSNCVGFSIATGSGGAVGTTFVDCSATAFFCGFQTGTNNFSGALAEGNKWFYCSTNGCYLGIQWGNSQSLVNSVFHCNIGAIRPFSSKGQDYVVIGGEHGFGTSNSAAVAISGTSALTSFTDFIAGGTGFTNYRFTTTVVPDYLPYWTQCPDTGFVYDVATVVLPGFGIVPLRLVSFNTSTNVATYWLWEGWVWAYYGQDVALSSTNFQTQLQAVTTLYACERGIYFEGPGHLIHCHYENNACCMALWDTEFAQPGDSDDMSGGQAIVDELCMRNANPANPSAGTTSVIQACQAFPWIRQVETNFVMRDTKGAQSITSNGRIVIEGYDGGDDNTTIQLVVDRSAALMNANLRYVGQSTAVPAGGPGSTFGATGYDPSTASQNAFGSKAFGFGEWDRSYWSPSSFTPAHTFFPRSSGTGTTKFIGYKPAPGECQRITLADVASIKTPVLGTAMPICARSMCIVEQTGAQTYSHVKDSAGDGFSYYANLSVNWSYVGATHLVTIAAGTHANWLFNGLEIGLDNGSGVVWYIVTGTNIYQTGNGTITVHRESVTNSMLAGTAGTTYSGATIQQRTPSLLGYGATVAI
jgi:hypothetical protein